MAKLLHAHRAPYGGVTTETLAGTKTLVTYSPKFQRLDPDGTTRTITLPALTSSGGLWFWITNTGTAGNLTVNNPAASLIVSILPGKYACVNCDGATWTLSGSGLNGTGTAAFTERVTTTDGVASGTARIVGGAASILSAAGTALTSSNTETVLASATLPANTIKLGTMIRVKYQGTISATTGATTLTIKYRLGATTLTGTAIISGSATTTAANLVFSGMIDIVGRAAPGATAAVVAHALFCEPVAAGAVTPKQAIMATTNFATTGALLLELTGTWSASDANSCRADIMNVEVIG